MSISSVGFLAYVLDFRYSASVAGALPIIPTAYYGLMGSKVDSIEGILNGTTNYILTQMARRKVEMKEALLEAQRLGVAETDPRLDIEGYDTAIKLLVAANSIMRSEARISDVKVSGIENVTTDTIRAAESRRYSLKLI